MHRSSGIPWTSNYGNLIRADYTGSRQRESRSEWKKLYTGSNDKKRMYSTNIRDFAAINRFESDLSSAQRAINSKVNKLKDSTNHIINQLEKLGEDDHGESVSIDYTIEGKSLIQYQVQNKFRGDQAEQGSLIDIGITPKNKKAGIQTQPNLTAKRDDLIDQKDIPSLEMPCIIDNYKQTPELPCTREKTFEEELAVKEESRLSNQKINKGSIEKEPLVNIIESQVLDQRENSADKPLIIPDHPYSPPRRTEFKKIDTFQSPSRSQSQKKWEVQNRHLDEINGLLISKHQFDGLFRTFKTRRQLLNTNVGAIDQKMRNLNRKTLIIEGMGHNRTTEYFSARKKREYTPEKSNPQYTNTFSDSKISSHYYAGRQSIPKASQIQPQAHWSIEQRHALVNLSVERPRQIISDSIGYRHMPPSLHMMAARKLKL